CPGICSPLLTGIADVVDRLDMEAGKDFNIITISFDPREDYLTASEKKKNYLTTMKKIPDNSWQFLTGDSLNIAKLTDAVGWRYQKQGNDFMHGSGIMVLSPDGKIVRYLFGITYLPFDMKMALTEASEGRTGPTISKIVKLCYSYDPAGRKYVFDFTKVAGVGILLILAVLFLVLILKKKKASPNLSGGKI
ncbi:MAG: SCO family protein, partial [Ignavibacteria bacterium]